MKKLFKKALLSMFIATATVTASVAATNLWTASAADEQSAVDTIRFEMVDGAAIRLQAPNGLRFIAELGKETYNDLMTEETGVEKKMGMFIMPYEYLSDATKYSDGATGVAEKNYENISSRHYV